MYLCNVILITFACVCLKEKECVFVEHNLYYFCVCVFERERVCICVT